MLNKWKERFALIYDYGKKNQLLWTNSEKKDSNCWKAVIILKYRISTIQKQNIKTNKQIIITNEKTHFESF